MIPSGLFVRFDDVFEGYVPARRLPGDYFELNELATALVGRRGGRTYRLGDPIEVRVQDLRRSEGKVELALLVPVVLDSYVTRTLRLDMTVFEALADPTRRQIVELLAEGERSAGEIASAFPVSRPGISRHLRVLREAGVASSETRGQQRLYRLDVAGLAEAEEWLARRRSDWNERLDALERHLRRKD